MKEEWKTINGYEGLYEVSNMGRVRSLDRKVIYKNGKEHLHKGRIKSQPNDCKTEYRVAVLSRENKLRAFKISRLVATNFIENKDKLPCVNHIDGNKKNDNILNLEWCTQSRNNIHAFDTGLSKYKNKTRGLFWDKERGRWIAYLYRNNKNIFIGRFDSHEIALTQLKKSREEYDKDTN